MTVNFQGGKELLVELWGNIVLKGTCQGKRIVILVVHVTVVRRRNPLTSCSVMFDKRTFVNWPFVVLCRLMEVFQLFQSTRLMAVK